MNNYLYKLEIELDDEKIVKDNKYELSSIYDTVKYYFEQENIQNLKSDEHIMTFISNEHDDFASFGLIEGEIMTKDWFRPYVKKMIWYNAYHGKNHSEDALMAFVQEGF